MDGFEVHLNADELEPEIDDEPEQRNKQKKKKKKHC
jgi:hypothetical protein